MHEIGIRDYAYLLRARLLVVRGKPAAEQWLDAGQLEEAGGDEGDRLPLRTIRAWGEDGVTSDEREPFDRVAHARRLVLPILDRGIRGQPLPSIVAPLEDCLEPIGRRIGQSAHEHG